MKSNKLILMLIFLSFFVFISYGEEDYSNWAYSQQVNLSELEKGKASGNDFVLVKLDSSNFTFSQANETGNDTRFCKAIDSTSLSYAIEKWEDNEGEIYVKIPEDYSEEYILFFWGNSSALSQSDGVAVFGESSDEKPIVVEK